MSAPADASALDVPFPDAAPVVDLEPAARKHGLEVTAAVRESAQKTVDNFMSELRESHRMLESIAEVPAKNRTFRNTVEALDDFYNRIEEAVNWPGFYAYVHPDPFVRAAGEEIDKYSSKYMVEVGSSRTLYLALKAFAGTNPPLTPEEKYLLDENLKDFEDGGVALASGKYEKFKSLSKELSDLTIDFSSNVRQHRDTLAVAAGELDGMDSDYISGLDRTEDGKYILTLDYPVFLPYMDYGRHEETRKILLTKFRNRARDKNIALLEKITRLRQERTKLLGRPTYADYIIRRRMAQTSRRAVGFLKDVGRRVSAKATREMAELTALKRELTGNPAATFEQWDRNFYSKILTKRKFDYDPQAVKEYFQTDRVIRALLDISQTIYGLRFERAPGTWWHEDVVKYDVFDASSASASEANRASVQPPPSAKKIGEFYMDLYPRPDKYTHAAAWGLRPHKIFADGRVQLPASAIVTNFQKPAPGRPSLLSVDEVETFFHEFGHLLHGILSTTRFASVSGTRVMRDFVEAPSQMFEKWVQDTAGNNTSRRCSRPCRPMSSRSSRWSGQG